MSWQLLSMLIFTLTAIGRISFEFLTIIGRLTLFSCKALSHCVRPPFYPRLIGQQLIDIGYFSLPVVGLTAFFTGMVLALQSYTSLASFDAPESIAKIISPSMTRELGPVLASLMVAGRIGAAMAAEIGTMRVTEQIDALSTLSANPYKYLIVPRLLAGVTMLPVLVFVADIIGITGGWVIAVYKLGFNGTLYIQDVIEALSAIDVISGLVKAAFFGIIISLMGCYHGFNSKGGAQGVGRATTACVVAASILILLFDYVLTEIFFTS